ncbi:MAG: class I SAM-dependent methyltransferase [Desulfomonile tiedjei]|nr:class I SAM-dependent methyltransferase [Desulfomonile tiedjei]
MGTGETTLGASIVKLMRALARTRWLRLAVAGWHFHVDAVSFTHDHLWDGTSLVLRKALRRYARDGYRVLDLGTGHLGLLVVYCATTCRVRAVAVDINEEYVENARLVAKASRAGKIDFRQSDWFSNVDGTFDLIFSNAPYVPSEIGQASEHGRIHPDIWDGGHDGLGPARTILADAVHFMKPKGLLLLGINTVYIPRIATLALIEGSEALDLRTIVESWTSPSEVYVLGLKHSYIRAHPPDPISEKCPDNIEWSSGGYSDAHIWGPHP